MRKARLLALATALCAGVAVPAIGQPYGQQPYGQPGPGPWDRIGSVDFSFRPDHEVAYGRFGGRIEALSFRARNGNVMCDSVTATFGNGRTREIYRGPLRRNRDVVVDLPGQRRAIRRIDFQCRSMAPRVTRVDIAADIGQYRAEWRRSPDWNRMWSRMFNWDDDQFAGGPGLSTDRYVTGPLNTAGWITVGSEVFDGRFDRETTVAGFAGRGVDRIALRPLNADARCSHVTATFGNGVTRELNIDDREVLEEDRVYELDLPGGDRNVTQIDMACRALNGTQVTMMVMANR